MATSISTKNAQSYPWGESCTAWHLVNTKSLSVIQEIIPPGASERKHRHAKAQQFFFVLKGKATFEIDGKTVEIGPMHGIHIKPKQVHLVSNESDKDLELLVISEPHSHIDRENV